MLPCSWIILILVIKFDICTKESYLNWFATLCNEKEASPTWTLTSLGISWEKILQLSSSTHAFQLCYPTEGSNVHKKNRLCTFDIKATKVLVSFRGQEAYHSLVLFMALERSSFFFRDKSLPAGTVFSWPRSIIADTDFFLVHARCFFLCYSWWWSRKRKNIEWISNCIGSR